MRILVTGGTGFLGMHLVNELIRKGHQVTISTRAQPQVLNPYPAKFVRWPLQQIDLETDLKDLDACIHLVGENLAQRWSKSHKRNIYDSRVGGTQAVLNALAGAPKLKVFISASAVGFYGDTGDRMVTEDASAGTGFLADVCKDWEATAKTFSRADLRNIQLRSGVVLGRCQGFLEKLEPVFRNHMAGPLGTGDQFLSWIHIDDWVSAVCFCLENPNMNGPVNLTAPEPCTNKTFTYTFGELFRQTFFPKVPTIVLRVAMGEMADMALTGQRAVPQKLMRENFGFKFSTLREALRDIYEISELNPMPELYLSSRQWLPVSPEKVFKLYADPNILEQISSNKFAIRLLKKSTQTIEKGTLLDFELKIRGIPLSWRSQIEDLVPGRQITEKQLQGPFKSWRHRHVLEPFGNGTLLTDEVFYELQGGALGRLSSDWVVHNDLKALFDKRRDILRENFSP
jgi:uncharacterized protein